MKIANPILDTVFKYLFEDNEIAKGLLSRITGLHIISLELKPTELTYEKFFNLEDKLNDIQKSELNSLLKIYRFDFKAIIKEANNEHKVVLIEIQKSNVLKQVGRFREYLGENYKRKEQIINADGKTIDAYLEIICIYFLNAELENISTAILKKEHRFRDAETQAEIDLLPNYDPFVKLLNHEAIYIQIPRLNKEKDSQLRKLLDIFDQDKLVEKNILELGYGMDEIQDELKKRIVQRLSYALMDETMQLIMKNEARIDEFLQQTAADKKELLFKIEESKKTIEEKDKTIEKKDKTIEEKDKTIEEKDKTIGEKNAEIERLKQALMKK